ncbi:hypothetical protein BH20ACI2_BH20ACI2_21110 [soil metagenome]
MNTAVETKRRFLEDPRWWKIALMDFVDDFRYYKDEKMIAEPYELNDNVKDAVLAGVIETLCDELGFEIPDWVRRVPPCREPEFLTSMESLKAISIVESPVRFRLRNIFVFDNFLFRV